jgi:hypothetical protein
MLLSTSKASALACPVVTGTIEMPVAELKGIIIREVLGRKSSGIVLAQQI